jgi:hypothetical protein
MGAMVIDVGALSEHEADTRAESTKKEIEDKRQTSVLTELKRSETGYRRKQRTARDGAPTQTLLCNGKEQKGISGVFSYALLARFFHISLGAITSAPPRALCLHEALHKKTLGSFFRG